MLMVRDNLKTLPERNPPPLRGSPRASTAPHTAVVGQFAGSMIACGARGALRLWLRTAPRSRPREDSPASPGRWSSRKLTHYQPVRALTGFARAQYGRRMQFGIFYEHQLPRPWEDGRELRLIQEALDQVELADRLGIDFAWEVEHHFLEEYSHSSAPEVFLAAASQRTTRIRLGHGIVLMPPRYNHPARVAERIAMLDLVSRGRVEFGTGESASRMELEGFGIDPAEKRAMWQEAVAQVALMLSQSPYPGHQGKHFSMPPRDVLPKPVQQTHPPMWLARSARPT